MRRADLQAVVHTHSVNATALACLERELPPFHYMVAVAGSDTIPCTPYHTFGSEALSAAVAQALSDRNACLLAHHGLVAAGATLAQAMKIAIEIESLCEVYLKALAVAEPSRLSAAQMAEVLDKFKSYGRSRRRLIRSGQVASSSPASDSAKATRCMAPKASPRNSTPTSAALIGSITVNTPACGAGTWRRPCIHSHTVTMLAAIE